MVERVFVFNLVPDIWTRVNFLLKYYFIIYHLSRDSRLYFTFVRWINDGSSFVKSGLTCLYRSMNSMVLN